MIITTAAAVLVLLLTLVKEGTGWLLGVHIEIPFQEIIAGFLVVGYLLSSCIWVFGGLGELGNFTKEYREENAREFNIIIWGVFLRCGCLFFGPLLVLLDHELLGVMLFIAGITIDRVFMVLMGGKVWALWYAD